MDAFQHMTSFLVPIDIFQYMIITVNQRKAEIVLFLYIKREKYKSSGFTSTKFHLENQGSVTVSYFIKTFF